MIAGIVPAAGYARRLQPLAGSKELLPVGGRPVIDYLVERMRLGGCSELRVVTRPEKRDVVEYARRLGAVAVEGRPASVAQSLLLGAAGLEPDDIVLFGFPDTLWEPADGFARLVEKLGEGEGEVVLGVFRTTELARSDVVVFEQPDRITEIHVKPVRPPSELIWGCLAARVRALAGLAGHDEPGEYLDRLARAGRVRGVCFDTELVDIGTREALEAAQ